LVSNPIFASEAFYPNDPWGTPNSLWKFSIVKANEAWAITKGKGSVKIAPIEPNGFLLPHEDLTDNIDFIDNNITPDAGHGTTVASCVAATTNNNKGISGMGYNCRLILIGRGWNVYDQMFEAYNNGASVISCSFLAGRSGGCLSDPSDQAKIDMLNDLGVVIVASAGNGTRHDIPSGAVEPRASCGNLGNDYGYPASYDNVICVSSTTSEDKLELYGCCGDANCSVWYVHTQNNKVDILAPGFCVSACGNNNSYYTNRGGTSFSTPFVASAIGLIKSINPCLKTPQVETILKNSGDDVSAIGNNASYYPSPSLVPKRLNVYKAVLEAIKTVSLFFKNQTLTGTNIYQASYGIYAGTHPDFQTLTGSTSIAANSNITFKATEEVYLGGDFEVQSGAEFEIIPTQVSCQ